METKVAKSGLFGPAQEWDGMGLGGRLMEKKNKYTNIHVKSKPKTQDVTVGEGGLIWRLTGFYGDADSSLGKLSWNTLRQLNDNSALPWVCGRDFNGILYSHEKKSQNFTPAWQVREFPAAISDANLADLGSGTKYTWCNNREEPHNVHSRLNRVFANSKRRDVFPGSCANSDHYSLLLLLGLLRQDSAPARNHFAL
ncbi:UNVERIFIED_CONTAM: hypothetical protein Scaly_2250200 [Sesamum calycinum]|uniref:Uncharacterized protein n=1 Tax=Sesamum calycinum TaxID=2727403 RepID=A0AAW2MCH5_9LAMI